MKYLTLLIALLLIFSMNSQTDDKGCRGVEVTDPAKCKNLTVPTGFKCCYHDIELTLKNGEKDTFKVCDALNNTQFDDIDKYIKELKESAEEGETISVNKIDCFAQYLQISIIALLILFI